MRINAKGQVTIPQRIRQQSGLLPDTEVHFVIEDDGVRIVPARRGRARGKQVVNRLRGKGNVPMTTDAILALTRKALPTSPERT